MKFKSVCFLCLICMLVSGCKSKVFSLEDKYYNEGNLIQIGNQTLQQLIENEESFAVFVYQPLCEVSSGFENILNAFVNSHNMSFYKIAYSDIKNTDLGKIIKYYPSFIIYENGEIVDYLEADKDEDTNYYKDNDEFEKWLSSYIVLNEVSDTLKNENLSKEEVKIDVVVDNISYDENKVNIYMFWGDGCPHCENAISFLESIENEYGKYFVLNKFEVWYDENNRNIYSQFASKMGDEVKGVPYIIIGRETFSGFSENSKDDIIEAITSQYKNSYDVYFSNK